MIVQCTCLTIVTRHFQVVVVRDSRAGGSCTMTTNWLKHTPSSVRICINEYFLVKNCDTHPFPAYHWIFSSNPAPAHTLFCISITGHFPTLSSSPDSSASLATPGTPQCPRQARPLEIRSFVNNKKVQGWSFYTSTHLLPVQLFTFPSDLLCVTPAFLHCPYAIAICAESRESQAIYVQ